MPKRVLTSTVVCENGVETIVQRGDGFTPTPVISRAILARL